MKRLAALNRVLADRRLRRVEGAFLAFAAAEYGVWVAVLVYAYERGGASAAAAIAVVQLLPAAAVAPIAAGRVDELGGAVVLRAGHATQAAALGFTGLALLGGLGAAVVYPGAVLAASAVTFVRPAQSALLPAIVRRPAELTAANAVTGWVESVSILIGPALAGVAIAVDGPGAALLLFAAAEALAALLVWPLGDRSRHEALAAPTASGGPEAAAAGIRGALRGTPGVPTLLALCAVQFIALGALDVLEVVLALHVLGLGAPAAGYLSATFGAGCVAGAAATLALVGSDRLAGTLLLAATGSGAAFLVLAAEPTAASAFAMLACIGATHAVVDVSARTILHRVVPRAVRGRVFGVLEASAMLGLAVGSVAVPTLSHLGGTTAALVGVGALLVGSAVACAPVLRSVALTTPVPAAELALLRRAPLFRILAAPVLEDLAHDLVARDVAAGEVIVRQGERGERFYLVDRGAFLVTVDGREVRTVAPGDGFGEVALLRDGVRIATVTAREPGRLYSLERVPFLEAMTGSLLAHRALLALVEARVEVT